MYESAPWRTELRKFAIILRDAPDWPCEEVPFELERAVFYSGAVLRKLIEDKKLTDSFTSKKLSIPVHTVNAPEKSSIWRNMPGFVEFVWQQSTFIDIPVKEICSQIVHFYGRYWWIDESEDRCGMIICSYRHQDKNGYFLDFNLWADVLDEAAEDWPTQITLARGGQRKVD